MAATIGEQILLAIEARLKGVAGIANLKVERNRGEPVAHFPTIVLQDGDDEVDDNTWGIEIHRPVHAIEIYVADSRQEKADAAADLLAGKAHQALCLDPTFGGLAVDSRLLSGVPGIDRTDRGKDKFVKTVALRISVEFWTRAGDPFTRGP